MAGVDVDTLTMEQCLALSRENQTPGVVKPEIKGNVNFEIKSLFMRELRDDTFSQNKYEDAHDHIDRTIKQFEDIHNVKQEGDESLYQAWERYNDMLYKCPTHDINSHQRPAEALTTIQTMADHSQKWHDGTTKRSIRGNSSNDGLAALVNKLDNPGRDMKKLMESVHAIQVGCQIYEGPHLDKDCPLNEEVKQVEEVRYGEFGQTTPFDGNNGGKFHVGPPGYYTKTDNRPPYGERRQSLEELLAKHQEESARRSTEMEVWIKKLQENAEINTRNQNASLKNLETQIDMRDPTLKKLRLRLVGKHFPSFSVSCFVEKMRGFPSPQNN
ncbi:hypothetical protein Tco_1477447 [Tanacetum coccineum]